MKLQPQNLSVISPADYRISVVGHLAEDMSSRFGGLTIENTRLEGDSEKSVTTLSGCLVDQAALLGVLNALYSMCLPLLAVECVSIDEPKGGYE